MASADTLCKKLLNVKNTVVESHDFYSAPVILVLNIPVRRRRLSGCELPEKLTLDGSLV